MLHDEELYSWRSERLACFLTLRNLILFLVLFYRAGQLISLIDRHSAWLDGNWLFILSMSIGQMYTRVRSCGVLFL